MKWVIGVDEVGRGPLAGPVSVGAVAMQVQLNDWKHWEGLRDSKKLTEKKREEWYERIAGDTRVQWGVAHSTAEMIDSEGIVPAIQAAASAAITNLDISRLGVVVKADRGIVVSGEWQQEQFTKGDETIPVIALASIMAKVTRDRMMIALGAEHPEYGFGVHKGYGTKAHQEAVRMHGMLKGVHRESFCRNLMRDK